MKELKFSFQLTDCSPIYTFHQYANLPGYQLLGINIEASNTLDQIANRFYDEFCMWCEEFKSLSGVEQKVYEPKIKEVIKSHLVNLNLEVPEWDLLPYLYFFGVLTWEEVQSIKAELEPTLTFEVLDICYPDYLQDHCNGERELLIVGCWHPEVTKESFVEEVMSDLTSENHDFWSLLPNDSDLAELTLKSILYKGLENVNLEMEGVDEPEEMYIYGRLSW